jgi:hypothetical protein
MRCKSTEGQMKIHANAFVTRSRWDSVIYGLDIVDYTLEVVVRVDAVKACVGGQIPLQAFRGSDFDLALQNALQNRRVVNVTVEVEE